MAELVGALDQGTTSTRFVVFDHDGDEVARHQLEHRQWLDRPGWVEHDPLELVEHTRAVIEGALTTAGLRAGDLVGIGVANQRETTLVWERATGRPIAPAIVWQDTRTGGRVARLVREGLGPLLYDRTGLPLTTYPSATKLQWILEEVPGARARAERGELCFGTVDSFLVFRLTGAHVTDVTNASRTMLMGLETLDWDDEILEILEIPRAMLPTIGASTRPVGELVAHRLGPRLDEVSVTALIGDQQSAMIGQACLEPGDTKCTYGTGNFVLVNAGTEIPRSAHGLITTVCYQFAGEAPSYALEGAIAVTGSAVQWLRDQLGVIERAADSEALAASVEDSEGLYFVPAFSGLFAPHWRSDARGVIVGLTRAHTSGHLARATLEAVGFQCRDVVEAIEADLGREVDELRVDGGMTENTLCMQIQADILGVPIVRAGYPETTARGAALAAGIGAGLFPGPAGLPPASVGRTRRWEPSWDDATRAARLGAWHRALERSLGWV